MIIVLKGADFSVENIGKIELPRELSSFTKQAITASGNAGMSKSQKDALDVLFQELGLVNKTGLSLKIKHLWLPMLAINPEKAFIDYVNNNEANIQTTSEKYEIFDFGIRNTISTTDVSRSASIKTSLDWDHLSIFSGFSEKGSNYWFNVYNTDSEANDRLVFSNSITGQGDFAFSVLCDKGQAAIPNDVVKAFTEKDGSFTNQVFYINGETTKYYNTALGWLVKSKSLDYPTSFKSKINCQITPLARLGGALPDPVAAKNKTSMRILAFAENLTEEEVVQMNSVLEKFKRVYLLG